MSIGLRPNASVKEMFCYFMMPDGSVVSLKDSIPLDRPTMEAKGLRFDMLEPEKRWKVHFVGGMERTTERKMKKSHVELSLEFTALNEAFDCGPRAYRHGQQASEEVTPGDLAQVGRLRGRLSTGLDEFEIDALGERRHSWGVTDWAAPKGWTRLTCQFSESHALVLTRLVTEEGTTDAGFVFQDGRNMSIKMAELNVNVDFDRNPKSFDLTLHDDEGDVHKVFGSAVKRVGIHLKSSDGGPVFALNETLTRYTIAGRNGYGIAELLSKTD